MRNWRLVSVVSENDFEGHDKLLRVDVNNLLDPKLIGAVM